MHIECRTITAAVEVVLILIKAHLYPGSAFRLTDPCSPRLPIRLSIDVPLPEQLLKQLQTIPDITIQRQYGA